MSQPSADSSSPATSPFNAIVDSRRPLIARFKDLIPSIMAANPRAKKYELLQGYLAWIEGLSSERNARLERAYVLAGQLGRSDADEWHDEYTTAYVIDDLLPQLEADAAALSNAKRPAH